MSDPISDNASVGRTMYGVRGSSEAPTAPPPIQDIVPSSVPIHVIGVSEEKKPLPPAKRSRLQREIERLGGFSAMNNQMMTETRKRKRTTIMAPDEKGEWRAEFSTSYLHADKVLESHVPNDIGVCGSKTSMLPLVERLRQIHEVEDEKERQKEEAKIQKSKLAAQMIVAADRTGDDEDEDDDDGPRYKSSLKQALISRMIRQSTKGSETPSPPPSQEPAPKVAPKPDHQRAIVASLDKDKLERFELQVARVMRIAYMTPGGLPSMSSASPGSNAKKPKFTGKIIRNSIDLRDVNTDEVEKLMGKRSFDRELHEWGIEMGLYKA